MLKTISYLVMFIFGIITVDTFAATYNGRSKLQYEAQYKVPVANEELSPYSVFTMKIKFRNHSNNSVLSYDLPIEITGREIEVQMKIQRTENGFDLHGPLGHGECSQKFSQVICKMVYNSNLNVNLNDVNQYLESSGVTDTELEQRQAVAEHFSVDPIGIISFEMN